MKSIKEKREYARKIEDLPTYTGFGNDDIKDLVDAVKVCEKEGWKIDEVQGTQLNSQDSYAKVGLKKELDGGVKISIVLSLDKDNDDPDKSFYLYCIGYKQEIRVVLRTSSLLSAIKKNIKYFDDIGNWKKEVIKEKESNVSIKKLIEKALNKE